MTDTLVKEICYILVNGVSVGRIGLPDIRYPFVLSNSKVRDLSKLVE